MSIIDISAGWGTSTWGAAQWGGAEDTEFTIIDIPLSISDTISLSDPNVFINVSFDIPSPGNVDTLVLSDAIQTSLFGFLNLKLNDTIILYDPLDALFSGSPAIQLLLEDIDILSDGISTDVDNPMLPLRDFIVLSDQVQAFLTIAAQLNDSILLDDSNFSSALSFTAQPLNDSISLSDSLTAQLFVDIQLTLSDSISLTDNIDNAVLSTSFDSYIRRYLNDVIR